MCNIVGKGGRKAKSKGAPPITHFKGLCRRDPADRINAVCIKPPPCSARDTVSATLHKSPGKRQHSPSLPKPPIFEPEYRCSTPLIQYIYIRQISYIFSHGAYLASISHFETNKREKPPKKNAPLPSIGQHTPPFSTACQPKYVPNL